MRTQMLGEIADNVSSARSSLSDALHLAQIAIMEGTEPDGWRDLLQRLYGEVAELERRVQDAERKAAA